MIIDSGCPNVTPCYLPSNNLTTNSSLLEDNTALLNAWFDCALQVDMIYQYQQEKHEKTNPTSHRSHQP